MPKCTWRATLSLESEPAAAQLAGDGRLEASTPHAPSGAFQDVKLEIYSCLLCSLAQQKRRLQGKVEPLTITNTTRKWCAKQSVSKRKRPGFEKERIGPLPVDDDHLGESLQVWSMGVIGKMIIDIGGSWVATQ